MAALRERSFSSQLLLSLSVFLHRRYGSERLIDVLHDLQLHMARGDVVVLIVETAMEESEHPKTAVILGEDIDMLVILIEHIQSHQEVFFKKDCHGWLGCSPIFDDFFQHLWPYIGNNTANVVFQMVKRLWLIRIDQ
ncbi:hypothetical protein TNCV_174191 [Trichonephila clavipes]|nr:hypothetical protein TNCV_174191 [Trichonephila clavipes]